MVLIIKKKVGLFIFLLTSIAFAIYAEGAKGRRYSCPTVYLLPQNKLDSVSSRERSKNKKLRESLKPLKKSISWTEQLIFFLDNPEIKEGISELLVNIYNDFSIDPKLERLKKEGEQLKTVKKNLQEDLRHQEDELKKSRQFFEEISRLQLDLQRPSD